MTQNWIEVRIESSADSGELLDQLDDPAVTGFYLRECSLSIRLKSLARLQRQVEWCSTRGSVTGGWRLK